MTDDECRREFEKWARDDGTNIEKSRHDGEYISSQAQDCWWVWQAAWQQSRTASEGVDIEAAARAIAVLSYHENGLETMCYAGEKAFADREWKHYENEAKACASAWGLKGK